MRCTRGSRKRAPKPHGSEIYQSPAASACALQAYFRGLAATRSVSRIDWLLCTAVVLTCFQ
jgi:hypothetical protein